MAYQSVKIPRFYCNVMDWADSNGYFDTGMHTLFKTLPLKNQQVVSTHTLPSNSKWPLLGDKTFIAIIGHNLGNIASIGDYTTFGLWSGTELFTDSSPIVNCFRVGDYFSAGYNGFSIVEYNIPTYTEYEIDGNWGYKGTEVVLYHSAQIMSSSIIIGTYYDMPHSPDLKLSMSRDYDGVKKVRTKGGNDLIQYKYTKPPLLWGNTPLFDIGYPSKRGDQRLSRTGRRIWDLSFTLQEQELFPLVSHIQAYEHYSDTGVPYPGEAGNQWWEGNTLITDLHNSATGTFYSSVIHKTNGGQLAFIFQPDNNNPDGFAICKFDMKDFKFTQISNTIYTCRLKIREVW